MRRHPFLAGIVLLLIIGFLFFILFIGLASTGSDSSLFSIRDKVAVVPVKGIITDSRTPVDLLRKYGEDGRVKAVVIRIDSPGGGVAPSQEIYEAVSHLKKKKKVVASMGSVAASGGYYIACAADRIVANPGTVTGSIGALMHFSNLEDLLKKVGLRSSIIKSGKYKDIGSPIREMTAEEKKLIQGLIDDIYDQFTETVSSSRNIPMKKLRVIADGRIFTGRQAMKLGLVDEMGDLEHSIDVAAKLAEIQGKPDVIYPKEKGVSIWRFIADEMTASFFRQLKNETGEIGFSGGMEDSSMGWQSFKRNAGGF